MDGAERERLRGLLSQFEARKVRAQQRLEQTEPPTVCFALLGFATSCQDFSFCEGLADLRSVSEPPGEVELARALSEKWMMSPVARYSHSITHELAFPAHLGFTEQEVVSFGWWLISAIRVRGKTDFLVPALCSHSWSTVAGLPDGSAHVRLLEDVPRARRFDTNARLSVDDFKWTSDHFFAWARLLQAPRFHLAVESLTTHQHHATQRMSIAALWAGVEALFSVNMELRFRLAALAASFLEKRGAERLALYQRIKKLYDFRSKAVHGSVAPDADMTAHIVEVRTLLSRLLCAITESGSMPSQTDYDALLFT